MACTAKQNYGSRQAATNSAVGGGAAWRGVVLRPYWCEEHGAWHIRRDKRQSIKPCPRCGGVAQGCRCMRDALQAIDPWDPPKSEDIGLAI